MRTILVTGVSTGIGRAIAEEVLKTEEFYVIGSVRKKDDASYLSENFGKFPVVKTESELTRNGGNISI